MIRCGVRLRQVSRSSLLRKAIRIDGDEHALPCSLPLRRPGKLLDVRSADAPIPPLRLEVDQIKAETILLTAG